MRWVLEQRKKIANEVFSKCNGIFEGCSHVIHLAAQGSPGASFEEVLSANVVATYNVLEEAKRANVKRVVFASTNHTQHGSNKCIIFHLYNPGKFEVLVLDPMHQV